MVEINIKISEINNAITKLQGLRTRCNSRNTTPPITVGGGKTVNALEEMAEVYVALNNNFGEFVSNTILFLQNVRDSYAGSDSKAAKYIGGGGSFGGGGSTRSF